MPMQSTYVTLFTAFRDAREAYDRLHSRHRHHTDAELARDPDYRRLHLAGMTIARMGGGSAIEGAIEAITDTSQTRGDLKRYWAGLDAWPN